MHICSSLYFQFKHFPSYIFLLFNSSPLISLFHCLLSLLVGDIYFIICVLDDTCLHAWNQHVL